MRMRNINKVEMLKFLFSRKKLPKYLVGMNKSTTFAVYY